MTSAEDADLRAELNELDWQEVVRISEDPSDPRRDVAKDLIEEMVRPLIDMIKAQTSDLQKLIKDMTGAATTAMRITADPIRFTMPKLPLFPKFSIPMVPKTAFAMPRADFGLDPAIWLGLSKTNEQVLEAGRRSADLLKSWRDQDWAAAGQIAETLVADTDTWPTEVDQETVKAVEALEPSIKEKDPEARVQIIMKNIVIVYVTILADRSVPDREQLYTLLLALIHLARALAR